MTTLINPTDDELNKAFASHVSFIRHPITGLKVSDKECGFMVPPPYTESMDAVLPWLNERQLYITQYKDDKDVPGFRWSIHLDAGGYGHWADALPKACVLALLKAHGVEVVYESKRESTG